MTDIYDKSITIFAADGSVKTVTRSQIILVDTTTKIKEAKSIGCYCRSVVEILKYYPKTDSYKMKFDLPDDNDSYIDVIKSTELRANKSLERSKIELEYFKNHT